MPRELEIDTSAVADLGDEEPKSDNLIKQISCTLADREQQQKARPLTR
jgi:hypothetical protein